MKDITFILISGLYLISLAVIDGMFNRLIFRENRKLSYFSVEKQNIYKLWEWGVIGALFLIALPIIFPFLVAFAIGGFRYVLFYLATLLMIPWDIIFGRIVFDDWFGDTPSISLPKIGWVHLPLSKVILLRLILFIITIIFLRQENI